MANNAEAPKPEARQTADLDRISKASAALIEESGKVFAALTRNREQSDFATLAPDEAADLAKTLGAVAQQWVADPKKMMAAQTALTTSVMEAWNKALQQSFGQSAEPQPTSVDKRFADGEWTSNPYFRFLKDAYLATGQWAEGLLQQTTGIDDLTRKKAEFYTRQVLAALSPSNFIATNPELIRTTVSESGENLVRGMRMLAEDIERGHGELKIRQTTGDRFEIGVNIATTPGKVVFRNDLIELIQYTPVTERVSARPVLVMPPWINKYYVLDLMAEKSFIRWMVDQGLSVFVMSWANPDARHRNLDWSSYMTGGLFAALDSVIEITGAKDVHAVGYCVGGTLLSASLAYMGRTKDTRIGSATLLATQTDFSDPGELKVFADETQIKAVEGIMSRLGYLPGEKMAAAFNMLRPQELIWNYWVANYLKGQEPPAFDLLYWNSDSTRMAEANHSFYLRQCYLENRLAKGEMVLNRMPIALSDINVPVYHLATKEDHIAPPQSVYRGAALFGGETTYVLAGSGHIAGVINPPARGKYQYWTGGNRKLPYEGWLAGATEAAGSWWPHWRNWLEEQVPEKTEGRPPGSNRYPPLADAPGTYVLERS
jgi:polyhydroxyalkanoate synthase subunit PhaC